MKSASRGRLASKLGAASRESTLRRAVAVAISSLSIAAAVSTVLAGQGRIILSGEPSCAHCEIRIEQAVVLPGMISNQALICDDNPTVSADEDFFYVAPSCDPGVIAVYDRGGQFLRTIGGFGQGPNEIGHILRVLVGPDGLLHVFDTGNQEIVITSDGVEVTRQHLLRTPYDFVQLSASSAIISAWIATPDLVALPVHVLDDERDVLRSFGSTRREYRADRDRSLRPTLALDGEYVWVAPTRPYELSRWRIGTGQLDRVLVREAAWFTEADSDGWGPGVTSIRMDQRDLLWVNSTIPTMDMRRFSQESPPLHAAFDSVIEVIDPGNGEVLAATTVPFPFWWWVQDYAPEVSEDETGGYRITMWRISLHNRQEEE